MSVHLTDPDEPRTSQQGVATSCEPQDELLLLLGHELRGRVHALCGALEVLASATAGSAIDVEARTVALRQARQITGVVDELLASGQVLTGRAPLAPHPIELAELVRRLIRGGTAVCDLIREPVWVRADLLHLEQQIVRLLRAAGSQAPGLRLTVERERDQGVLRIESSDGSPLGSTAAGVSLVLARRVLQLQGGSLHDDGGAWCVTLPLDTQQQA